MKQTKVVTLERCQCGAYRYIVTRDQDRVITFYLQHLVKNQERRESKMIHLFTVKKSSLDYHLVASKKPREGNGEDRPHTIGEKLDRIISLLEDDPAKFHKVTGEIKETRIEDEALV